MPPKKKGNGRKTNTKKGNKSSNNRHSSAAARAPSNNANDPASAIEGDIPDMSGFERRNPNLPDNYSSVYHRYKDATKRFFTYMEKQAEVLGLGNLLDSTNLSVNTLMTIADGMHDDGRTMGPLALRDLKMSIQIRFRVAKSVFGGGGFRSPTFSHHIELLLDCPREASQGCHT